MTGATISCTPVPTARSTCADGVNDLLTVNIIGSVRIALGTGSLIYRSDSTLFTTSAGCTGAELVPHDGTGKGFYFGFNDGTVDYNYPLPGNLRASLTVYEQDGQPVDVGDDANVTAFDITGDGRDELLIGNSSGRVEIFARVAADTLRSLGTLTAAGTILAGAGGIMLSGTFGSPDELPSLVYSDGSGRILRADINNDGTVDILDLQQLGIHWGQQSTDPGWSGATNLQVQTATADPQVINVLDLLVLANYWGAHK